MTDNLTLTTGLRYTKDKKSGEAGGNPAGPVTTLSSASGSWEEVTGKVNLNWNVTENSSLYTTLSRGYKGGGLNGGRAVAISETFDPEYVNALEIGSKNKLLDSRMQINTAAFYYDYQDYQVGGLIDGIATNFNAESIRIQGFEFESLYLITQNLLMSANFSLLDTEIRKSLPLVNVSLGSSTATEDVEGNDLPNAPEKTINLGVQYTHSLSDQLELVGRVAYYWQDRFQGREFDNFTYDSWGRTDVYLSLNETQGRWKVEAFVKNITNDDGITAGVPESNLVGLYRKLSLLDPRTYGIEVSYHWE